MDKSPTVQYGRRIQQRQLGNGSKLPLPPVTILSSHPSRSAKARRWRLSAQSRKQARKVTLSTSADRRHHHFRFHGGLITLPNSFGRRSSCCRKADYNSRRSLRRTPF